MTFYNKNEDNAGSQVITLYTLPTKKFHWKKLKQYVLQRMQLSKARLENTQKIYHMLYYLKCVNLICFSPL